MSSTYFKLRFIAIKILHIINSKDSIALQMSWERAISNVLLVFRFVLDTMWITQLLAFYSNVCMITCTGNIFTLLLFLCRKLCLSLKKIFLSRGSSSTNTVFLLNPPNEIVAQIWLNKHSIFIVSQFFTKRRWLRTCKCPVELRHTFWLSF